MIRIVTHSASKRLIPWVKAIIIVLMIVFATGDGWTRFLEFEVSDNPWRNRLIFLAIWLTVLVAAVGVGALASIWLKIVLGIPLCLAVFSALMYRAVAGSELNYSELYTMWASRSDIGSAAANYWGQSLLPLLWSTMLLLVIVWPSGRVRLLSAAGTMTVLLHAMPVLAVTAMLELKGGAAALGLPPSSKVLGMLLHVLVEEAGTDFDARRETLTAQPSRSAGNRPHIVWIVDESVRGDYLSINGHLKPTTPFLAQLERAGRLHNFGQAVASFDCSHYSNLVMRYGLPSANITNAATIYPSIWEFARRAGYATTFIDSQRRHGQLTNFMSMRERKLIDNFVQFSDVDAVERSPEFVRKDESAARIIAELLSRAEPQFIYVNKEGAHAPYEGKYPESETVFRPTMKLREPLHEGLSIEALQNSYRNAVRWAVDHFFMTLLSERRLERSIVYYTSDHGQNLLEQGVVTHCGSGRPPQAVADVPLFVLTDDAALGATYAAAARLNRNRTSHFNLFATVVATMGYNLSELPWVYDPPLTQALSGDRSYRTGNPFTGEIVAQPFLAPQ